MGLAISIYTFIVIKRDAVKYVVKSNDNITLQNPPTITKPRPRRRSKPKISNITFAEVDALYDKLDYTATDLQRDELIKRNYIGKLVQWTGEVADVDITILGDKLYVKFKHTEKSLISDVTVYFPNSKRKSLLRLQEGDWVTYQGKIESIGVLMYNHKLVDGKIIRVQRN